MGVGFSKASYFNDLSKVEFTEEQKEFVEKLIQSDTMVIFSKDYCPHCISTKRLLQNKYCNEEDEEKKLDIVTISNDEDYKNSFADNSSSPSKKNIVKIIEINRLENGLIVQAILFQITGQKSVPNVFVHGKHIPGGNSQLHKLANSDDGDQLKQKLFP